MYTYIYICAFLMFVYRFIYKYFCIGIYIYIDTYKYMYVDTRSWRFSKRAAARVFCPYASERHLGLTTNIHEGKHDDSVNSKVESVWVCKHGARTQSCSAPSNARQTLSNLSHLIHNMCIIMSVLLFWSSYCEVLYEVNTLLASDLGDLAHRCQSHNENANNQCRADDVQFFESQVAYWQYVIRMYNFCYVCDQILL